MTENKQRIRDITSENRMMPVSHQMQMEVKQSELYVNGDKYQKAVMPPNAKDVLLITKQQEKALDGINILSGQEDYVDGSKFYSMVVEASTLKQVQDAYRKIKLQHASATHIICGYRIFGIKHHIYQDYSDDGEYGAGRKILNTLKQRSAFNIAVFIVRYKTGSNLGAARFAIFEKLTLAAIALKPQ